MICNLPSRGGRHGDRDLTATVAAGNMVILVGLPRATETLLLQLSRATKAYCEDCHGQPRPFTVRAVAGNQDLTARVAVGNQGLAVRVVAGNQGSARAA